MNTHFYGCYIVVAIDHKPLRDVFIKTTQPNHPERITLSIQIFRLVWRQKQLNKYTLTVWKCIWIFKVVGNLRTLYKFHQDLIFWESAIIFQLPTTYKALPRPRCYHGNRFRSFTSCHKKDLSAKKKCFEVEISEKFIFCSKRWQWFGCHKGNSTGSVDSSSLRKRYCLLHIISKGKKKQQQQQQQQQQKTSVLKVQLERSATREKCHSGP